MYCAQCFTVSDPIRSVWENHKYLNNKVQVSMQTWKNKKVLDNTIKRTFAHANSHNLLINNISRCFDWVFRRPYRYFSFVLKSDFIPVWSLWGFHHWMILDWIAVINCLIKKGSKWLKLILSSVRMLLNVTFRCLEILMYFLSCDPLN